MANSNNTAGKNLFQQFIHWLYGLPRSLSERIELFSEVALPNLFTLILLVILYLFYWTFPQAKDLLLTINQEGHMQIFLFFASLVTMAAICWYMPRFFYEENKGGVKGCSSWNEVLNFDLAGRDQYLSQEKYSKRVNSYNEHFKGMIPRILSSGLLFLVALGILNVGNEINFGENTSFIWKIPAHSILGIAILLILVILLFETGEEPLFARLNNKIRVYFLERKKVKQIYFIFSLIALGMIGLMWAKKGEMDDLPFLLTAALLLSLAFFVFTLLRKYTDQDAKDYYLRRGLLTASGALSLLFILINFFPGIAQRMNPLVCANLAFVFYISLLYLLRLFGHRNNILAVLFLFGILVFAASITNSHRSHEVSYVPNTFNPDDRLSLKNYFTEWIETRKDYIQDYLAKHPGQSFPVLIVSSEGGGSRAAYWTSLVHGYLDDQSGTNYYKNHLFALTGASGGNTGNSTFLAMKNGGILPLEMDSIARTMFQENYLSSSLTLLLGADLLKDIFGLGYGKDRAKRLEKEWSRKIGSALNGKVNAFEIPFLDLWYGDNHQTGSERGPLLFINATQVQGARHGIFSPVTMPDTAYWGIDLLAAIHKVDSTKTIPLVTANLLNASFPYINPAGNIKGVGSFVDAGYFDNYGARTSVAVLHELNELRAQGVDTLLQDLKFISVLIRNGTVDHPSDDDDLSPTVPLSNQLTAPVSTLGGIRSAINDHNLWTLRFAADTSYLIDLKKEPTIVFEGSDPIQPIIPLARYLSPLAIKAMDASLDSMATSTPPSSLVRLLEEIEKK